MGLYAAYRKAMRDNNLTQADIAKEIDRSSVYVSRCLCGSGCFTHEECYTMMKIANLPLEDIYYYFPPHGKFVPQKEKKEESAELVLVNRTALGIVKDIFRQII